MGPSDMGEAARAIPDWLGRSLDVASATDRRVSFLSSRRGATTVTITSGRRKALVKLAEDTKDGIAANVDGIWREYEVLSSTQFLVERFCPQIIEHDSNVALVEAWIDGFPAFRRVNSWVNAGNEASVIDLLRKTLQALAALHAAGWAHGDLQPLHFIDTGAEVVLLDYGVAQSRTLPMNDYRGGMVHFNAPEVAAQIISTGHASASPSSDVFSLGSVFAFCVLSEVLGEYDKSDSWQTKQEALARGALKLDVLRRRLLEMPALRDLLLALLAINPDGRPRDAAEALRFLSAASQ